MTLSRTWTILLAGELVPTTRLHDQLEGSRFVAADAGMRHAPTLGVTPEIWIGDFDSAPGHVAHAVPEEIVRQSHPRDKDLTDGALAVAHALEAGAERIILAGAFGGRADHVLAHLAQVLDLAGRGVEVLATSGLEEAWPLLPGRPATIDLPAGSTFSLFGFGPLGNVTLRGARWPLDATDIPFASTRTLSNVAEGPVSVEIGTGAGLLLARPAVPENTG